MYDIEPRGHHAKSAVTCCVHSNLVLPPEPNKQERCLLSLLQNSYYFFIMLPSLSSHLLPLSFLACVARCATVTHDFDIGWTYANPDGQQTRPVIGINGQWPVPPIVATKGDQIIVNVKNSLGNESTSLHFHGLYMNGTTHMDGPIGVTQCGIPPGGSFTYNFTVGFYMFGALYGIY